MNYRYNKKTGEGEYYGELEGLELTMKALIDGLPRWCKGLPRDHESHEWINTYGHGNSLQPGQGIDKHKTIMFPYYLCRHCHAVSSNFTTSTHIKRVR